MTFIMPLVKTNLKKSKSSIGKKPLELQDSIMQVKIQMRPMS